VVLDRPGVGANLQDHLQMMLTYRLEGTKTLNQRYNAPFGRVSVALEYALLRRGPMAMGPSPLGIFLRSDRDRERANLAFTVLPFARVAPAMKTRFHPFRPPLCRFTPAGRQAAAPCGFATPTSPPRPTCASTTCRPRKTARSRSTPSASRGASCGVRHSHTIG